jgi:hypothetical protein
VCLPASLPVSFSAGGGGAHIKRLLAVLPPARMLRETTFWLGGLLTVALGVVFAVGLYVSGAGFDYFDAYLASGFGVGLGTFFLYVARDEHRDRLAFLASSGNEPAEPPGSGHR